jgi:branched-chain amino acid transport system ATP-binding protein
MNSEINTGNALFQAIDLHHAFGGVKAVSGFSCTVDKGDIKGIIGPNGAGKTTVFNLMTGVYRPDSGTVALKGENITGSPSHRIVAKGISRTFQNIRLFKSMSVLDNVRTAAYCRLGYPLWSAMLRTRGFAAMEKNIRESSVALLEKFGLAGRMHESAAALPYGQQRKVELARALANKPSVLLLDEPGAGMNPTELNTLSDLILWVRGEFSPAIILIEHRMRLVMNVCESVKVLNFGETIFDGKPGELSGDEIVVKAYFGDDHENTLG